MPAPAGAPPTALYRAYRGFMGAALPLAYPSLARKLRRAGVAEDRIRERRGEASAARPEGPLAWFHAASVGESLSVLTLISRMGDRMPRLNFLITSGTATSAELIGRRLPPRTQHQFAPLDAPAPVSRFLAHWRPSAAIFVESELWPVMLAETRATGARLALLNARLSPKSVRGWSKWPETARFVLDGFSVMISQNRTASDNLLTIGADPARVQTGSNLKSTSAPLPVDSDTLARLEETLGGRPLWVASSTHPGEEEVVLAAQNILKGARPDLCLILVPRHPERGDAVETLVLSAGLSLARRSRGEWPDETTEVYLADTLGETGTWYAAAPIVFLGGSLRPIGGHNPFEPAQAGAAVLTGPHVTNFGESFDPLIALGGAERVEDSTGMARVVGRLLDDPDRLVAMRSAARQFAAGRAAALDGVIDTLVAALGLEEAR